MTAQEKVAKRRTAANSPALANVRRMMNKTIYAHASSLLNTQGEDAMIKYLDQSFREPGMAAAMVRGE